MFLRLLYSLEGETTVSTSGESESIYFFRFQKYGCCSGGAKNLDLDPDADLCYEVHIFTQSCGSRSASF
jgi:hypothetical protein